MISVIGLEALVLPALALTCVAPVVLVYLVLRDIREKSLW